MMRYLIAFLLTPGVVMAEESVVHRGISYKIIKSQMGLASVYWPGDGHSGKWCSDGKEFTPERCHVAHRSWPLGRTVRVCTKDGRKCAFTFVGDRGPFGACVGHGGVTGRYFRCKGKWVVKITSKAPGVWRGILDMSRCVLKRLGGTGPMQITVDLLEKIETPRFVCASCIT